MTCPLQNLHSQFDTAIRTHTYMGPTKGDPKKLESTNQKTIRLAEVFKLAREQIEESLKGKQCPDAREISHLRVLQHDGRIIYQRYEKLTNGWIRTFMKCLAHYTPEFLKKILPYCFSNELKKAEEETLREFEEYRIFIRDQINKFSKKNVDEKGSEEHIQEKSDLLTPLIDEDGEEIFDPDQDFLPTKNEEPKQDSKLQQKINHKLNKPGTKEDSKTDPKKSALINSEQEKHLQEMFEKGVLLDDENPELQMLLEQMFITNTPTSGPNSDSEDAFQKGDSQKDKQDDSLPCFDLSLSEDELEIVDDPTQEEKTQNKQFNINLTGKSNLPDSSLISEEERQKAIQQMIEMHLSTIEKYLQLLKNFEDRPLPLKMLINIFKHLYDFITTVQLNPEGENALKNLGLNDKEINAFKDPNLKVAFFTNNHDKIAEILAPWKVLFDEAFAQKGHIKFMGVQKLGGMDILKLANDEGKPVKESDLLKYRGKINISIANTQELNDLKKLVSLLENTPTCRPCSIVINLKEDQPLTPELTQILLKLKDRVAQVEVQGLQEINFKTLALSEEEELTFVQHLDKFLFSQLSNIILSDHEKKNWKAQDFSNLLKICPKLKLLKQCYQLCSSYHDILIPSLLQNKEKLNAKELTLDQISHLITHLPRLRHLNLSGLSIKDEQLLKILKQIKSENIEGLELDGCQELTTDVLVALANLPNLVILSLPDLPKGKIALDRLPKVDNPFKIKLLYTASKETQPLATSLYTGPQIWASLFQIPLARLGVKTIFPAQQRRIDPKSVAYWLYNDDYQHLAPHENISTVLADSNAGLNDDNIIEFMQKFPKAMTLSLYNCPNVTNEGIIKLLKACPQLQTLDLTECPHIKEGLLLGNNHVEILKKLHKIIVSGTGISADIVQVFQEQGVKLLFTNTTLKVTDADLTDDQALEKILKGKDLTKIKTIDLEGCEKLTNKMLGQLLDHLNAPIWIKGKESGFIDNPERLNAAVINIKGCINITEEAFHEAIGVEGKQEAEDSKKIEESAPTKINLKLLENLNRMIIGGTKIPALIKDLYPQVIFQETNEPVTIQIDPELQLEECKAYQSKKAISYLDEDEDPALKRLAECYVHNRIVVELFNKETLQEPFEPNSQEFCDITLTFMTQEPKGEEETDITVFSAHRDVLYSQSLYFINGFRAGGIMSKNKGLDILNVHANSKAAKAVMDLFYGKLNIENLDWKTAADVAEMIGPHIFNLSPFYCKQLLKRIHDQFDLNRADEMLVAAKELGDEEGKKEYENTLLFFLTSLEESDQENFQKIANLAKSHGLKKLETEVNKTERAKTDKLIKQEMDEQNAENEELIKQKLDEIEQERDSTSFYPWDLLRKWV